LKWGKGNDKVIDWKVLGNDKHVTEDPLCVPDSVAHAAS
jgi:hypothetical protein